MIAEQNTGKGIEYNYPEYSEIIDANGKTSTRGSFYSILFGLDGNTAEIILLSIDNRPIDDTSQLSNSNKQVVYDFIKDNYDVENVRLR